MCSPLRSTNVCPHRKAGQLYVDIRACKLHCKVRNLPQLQHPQQHLCHHCSTDRRNSAGCQKLTILLKDTLCNTSTVRVPITSTSTFWLDSLVSNSLKLPLVVAAISSDQTPHQQRSCAPAKDALKGKSTSGSHAITAIPGTSSHMIYRHNCLFANAGEAKLQTKSVSSHSKEMILH